MKLKRAIILGLLLAILTAGAVSASDNSMTSDNLAADKDASDPIEVSDEANEITSDESTPENPMFNITLPDTVRQDTPFEVTFTGPADANGEIRTSYYDEFYEGDMENSEHVENGIAKMSLTLPLGKHNVSYEFYNGDYEILYSSSFIVNVSELFDVTVPDSIKAGTPVEVTFTGPSDLNGELEVTIYGKNYEDYEYISVNDGKAVISLLPEHGGKNYYEYYFEGTQGSFAFTVPSLFNVSGPKSVYESDKATFTFTGSSNLNGYIDIEWDDDGAEFDRFTVKNGKATATVKVPYLNEISYSFTSSDSKTKFDGTFAITVLKKPIINANDFKKDYSSKKKYQVRVLDKNKKSVGAGKTVTFHLYKSGKKVSTKTAKTDKNGYAKVDFNVASGSYKIKTVYGPASVTKKYNVNSILKIKYEKLKDLNKNMHTSNKIVWSVYLKKVDGKYLKGKKIKFTIYKQVFKGTKTILKKVKTITVKTNKKGVATITFKKSPVAVSSYYMKMGVPYMVKTTYSKDRLLCGDLNNDPYFTLYAKSPFKYYFGPGWHPV